MSGRLTTKGKWEDIWATTRIPHIHKPNNDTKRQLETYLPKNNSLSFLEVGCAPGGWMAYFAKQFGFQVAGIEYAENAADITRHNLAMQGLPAVVITADFFSHKLDNRRYDVVFSSGFIEHFQDLESVIGRHCLMTKQYLVIKVPNLFGINGLISKSIRPKVYAEHKLIGREDMIRIVTKQGLLILFCDYIGGIRFIMPAAHRPLFIKCPLLSKVINTPVLLFNKISNNINDCFGSTPRWRVCSQDLLLIAEKDFSLETVPIN